MERVDTVTPSGERVDKVNFRVATLYIKCEVSSGKANKLSSSSFAITPGYGYIWNAVGTFMSAPSTGSSIQLEYQPRCLSLLNWIYLFVWVCLIKQRKCVVRRWDWLWHYGIPFKIRQVFDSACVVPSRDVESAQFFCTLWQRVLNEDWFEVEWFYCLA